MTSVRGSLGRAKRVPFSNRILSRVIVTTVGHDITTFQNKRELLASFIDSIKGHRALVSRGILHRDISINNILIDRTPSSSQKGILIDLDYAIKMSRLESSGAPHRTGTYVYMAIEILDNENTVHDPRHDLESFLYVFLHLCTLSKIPSASRSQTTSAQNNRDPSNFSQSQPAQHTQSEPQPTSHATSSSLASPLYVEWASKRSHRDLADSKHRKMTDPNMFREIEACFHPDMKDLVPLARSWRKLLFRYNTETEMMDIGPPKDETGRQKLYEDILALLERELQTLSE